MAHTAHQEGVVVPLDIGVVGGEEASRVQEGSSGFRKSLTILRTMDVTCSARAVEIVIADMLTMLVNRSSVRKM